MGNLLNLYRIRDDSQLGLRDEGFGVRTVIQIRNISMRARYAIDFWLSSFSGEFESSIGKVTIAADITVRVEVPQRRGFLRNQSNCTRSSFCFELQLDKSNFEKINLNKFECLTLEDVKLKKISNTPDAVSWMISSALDSSVANDYLRSSLEEYGKEYIQTAFDPKGDESTVSVAVKVTGQRLIRMLTHCIYTFRRD